MAIFHFPANAVTNNTPTGEGMPITIGAVDQERMLFLLEQGNIYFDQWTKFLTHVGQDFPFRKWLKPGEDWETPKTFICLYADTDDLKSPVFIFFVQFV